MSSDHQLPTLQRGDFTFCSANSFVGEDSSRARHEESLISFLAAIQRLQIDILPITWTPGLDELGRGLSSTVNQAVITAQSGFAFKRVGRFQRYKTLVLEATITCLPQIRNHFHINKPYGICWGLEADETSEYPGLSPILVYPKTPFGTLKDYLDDEEAGRHSLRDRLSFGYDIAEALSVLHDSRIVHGDIKPENILVFEDDDHNVVMSISDFGCSSFWESSEDLVVLPVTRPWTAPEWHHRPVTAKEAQRMDVFSFGILFLWLLLQGENGCLLKQSLPQAVREKISQWDKAGIEEFKYSGSVLDDVFSHLEASEPTESGLINDVQAVLRDTLVCDPQSRSSDLSFVTTLLKPYHEISGACNADDALKAGVAFPTLEEAHAYVNFMEAPFPMQIAKTDYEIRVAMARALETTANGTEEHPYCMHCSQMAGVMLASFESIGFAKGTDQMELSLRIQTCDSKLEQIREITTNVRKSCHDDQDIYHSKRFNNLIQQGHIHIKEDTEPYFASSPLRSEESEEGRQRELACIVSSLGRHHPITSVVKRDFALHLKALGQYKRAVVHFQDVHQGHLESRGENDFATVISMTDLAGIYSHLGDFNQAALLGERAYVLEKEVLGNEHTSTQMATEALATFRACQGRYGEALSLFATQLRTLNAKLGTDHPYVIHLAANLAHTLASHGEWSLAEELQRLVLKISLTIYGQRHLLTAQAKASLAMTLQHQANYEEAERLDREATIDFVELLGEKHPKTIQSKVGSTLTCRFQGRYVDAERQLRQLIPLAEEQYHPLHPEVLNMKASLAEIIEDQGLFSDALERKKCLYEQMKQANGVTHPDTLLILGNLAACHTQMGHLEEAEVLGKEAIKYRTESFGENGIKTLQAKANLAVVYSRQGRLSEAEALQKEVLDAEEALLGKLHPTVITSRANFAATLHEKGRSEEAIEMLHGVVRDREEALGKSHPLIYADLGNLAVIYSSAGRTDQAKDIEIDVLGRRRDNFGPEHPQTLLAMQNLSATHTRHGNFAEAEELLRYVVDVRQRQPDHVNNREDLALLGDLASVYGLQDRWSQALPLMREVFDGRMALLGEKDPETIRAAYMVAEFSSMEGSDMEPVEHLPT